MNNVTLKSDAILLATAFLWGFAFVAQRVGMEFVEPFTFNGVRFALGCLVLLPLVARRENVSQIQHENRLNFHRPRIIGGGLLAGLVLFGGASLQQVGIVYTTAGNAGFITGLYVVMVPIILIVLGRHSTAGTWIGAVLSICGLYLLSVTSLLAINYGDMLVLVGAMFWALHVIIIGWLSPQVDSFKLAFAQYAVCSFCSMCVAISSETITMHGLLQAGLPLFYGGVVSVGIAYTMQVVAQKSAHPAHAAILLSMEAVFAAMGGYLLLNETMTGRQFVGCALILAGILISQLWIYMMNKEKEASKA